MTDVDLRLGRWQDALVDVADVHCIITDPPYGARTHAGQRHGRRDPRYSATRAGGLVSSRGLGYAGWSEYDVREFVASWAPRCRGWFCAMTSHDLVPHWIETLEKFGRYVFAPIACVQPGMNVRLAGDGPSNWTVWMVVSRPRKMRAWGTLPGAYIVGPESGPVRAARGLPGGKPIELMRKVVTDYSRPGDLVCDPTCGAATTLLAARMEGRRSVGSEMDPATYEKARRRLAHLPVSTETQRALFDT